MKEYKEFYSDLKIYKKRVWKKDIKMKGGTENNKKNYDWKSLKDYFKKDCKYTGQNLSEFNFQFKKIMGLNIVIFGKELNNNYLQYVYYLYKNNVKFKEIIVSNDDILFKDIPYGNLDKSLINSLYENLIKGTAQYSNPKTPEQIILKDKFLEKINLQPQPQPLQLQPSQPQQFPSNVKPMFNITKKNIINTYNYYRCEDPSLEVKIQDNDGNIFFGYDEYLFVKAQDNSYKLYYKYSYRNGKFFQLIKKQDGTFEEKQIDINLIPTYDILRLYDAIKKDNKKAELKDKLNPRIEIAKKNISNTGDGFLKLDHSNFEKEKRQIKNSSATENTKKITSAEYKNFGKVKKRRVTEKTYIFFGAKLSQNGSRNFSINFMYVCFREDNNVFYHERRDINKKIPLYDFPYIYPLEDLISFILLRRLITNDSIFADIIYKEADSRIKFLKTNKFAEKMLIQEFPENYYYGNRNMLYPNKRISLLPVSSQIINLK